MKLLTMYYINSIIITFFLMPTFGLCQDTVKVQSSTIVGINTNTVIGINGSVVLENGSSFINNGIVHINKFSTNISGHFINDNTLPYRMGQGTFILNSLNNGVQFLKSSDTLTRIEINSDSIQFYGNTVATSWYLRRGKINTLGNYAIVTGINSNNLSADTNTNINFIHSWFIGNLRRHVSFPVFDSYIFPIGNIQGAKMAKMVNANTLRGVDYIDATFKPKLGNDIGLNISENGSSYVSVNEGGVWHLTPNNQPSSGVFDLQLFFPFFTNLTDNSFGILRRTDSSTNATDWEVPIGSSISPINGDGRLVSNGYAKRHTVFNFGQFGIGSSNSILPVSFGDFTAQRNDRTSVKLMWHSNQELNVKGYSILRRLEKESNFSPIWFEKSKGSNGNSNLSLDYTYLDPNNYSGISYYQLAIIDNDNSQKLSPIKAIKGWKEKGIKLSVHPNPANQTINLSLKGSNLTQIKCFLLDIYGRRIKVFTLNNLSSEINVSTLNSGTYFLVCLDVFERGDNLIEKLIISR